MLLCHYTLTGLAAVAVDSETLARRRVRLGLPCATLQLAPCSFKFRVQHTTSNYDDTRTCSCM
jgi:hypothetical protein